MEWTKVIICSVVGFLGLLSAVLAFAAEHDRITIGDIQRNIDKSPSLSCEYSANPVLGLALGAAATILIAQIIVLVATSCFCCRRGAREYNSKWIIGLICLIASWVTFVNGFRLLIQGAIITGQHKEVGRFGDVIFCEIVRPGRVFALAGILCLATAVFGIVGYLFWDSSKESDNPWGGGGTTSAAPNQGGIAMGQPQFPNTQYPPQPQIYPPQPQYPPPNAPAFVHEDTYMRRQYS